MLSFQTVSKFNTKTHNLGLSILFIKINITKKCKFFTALGLTRLNNPQSKFDVEKTHAKLFVAAAAPTHKTQLGLIYGGNC